MEFTMCVSWTMHLHKASTPIGAETLTQTNHNYLVDV